MPAVVHGPVNLHTDENYVRLESGTLAILQGRLYVGAGGNLSLAPPKSLLTAAVCSSKTSNKLYRGGGVYWRVGVVDLVVLACVLRRRLKRGRQLFVLPLPPNIFF